MDEGTHVIDHVLKMFDHLNTLEIINGEVDIILESLSDSFNQFKLSCSMNKINFTFCELLNALQTVKGIIKGHYSVDNVEKTLLYKPFPKGKSKQKKEKVPSNPNKILNSFRDIGKEKKVIDIKPKGKCFHCGGTRHWKRIYLDYLAQKKNSGITESLIVEVGFIPST